MTVRAPVAMALLVSIGACTAPAHPSRSGAATSRPQGAPPSAPAPSPREAEEHERSGDLRVPETWLVWTLGGIPPGLADSIRALPEIRDAVEVASGTTWLVASGDEPVPGAAAGFGIPFEVAAVPPRDYATFLPRRFRSPLRRLGPLDALLGRTAAALRDLPASGIALREGNLSVRGVVPDRLIGAHEALVSTRTGRSLGITSPRYVLARPAPDTETDRIRRSLANAVPAGLPVRIRAPGSAAFLRHADLTLPQSRLKALFGEFSAAPAGGWFDVEPSWVRRSIVEDRVPILGRVQCHRRVVPLVRGALRELARRGLSRLVDPAQYGGCYAPRFIGRDPGAGLSHHAWGVAIDVNVADNPLGAEPTMDPRVVRAFERWGFVWGGDFIRPDGHHFEFRCFPDRCG